jgi:hypothetical protein
MTISRETVIERAEQAERSWPEQVTDLYFATLEARPRDKSRTDAAYTQWDDSIVALMQDEFLPEFISAVPLHSPERVHAVASRMSARLHEIYGKQHVSGPLHRKNVDEKINPLVGPGRLLTTLGHNSYSIDALKFWMTTRLAPDVDIEEARPDGSFKFTDGSEADMPDLIEAHKPASYSVDGWLELFPSAADFEEAHAKLEARRANAEREGSPWLDSGLTSRDGRFRSFRDGQV